MELKRSYYKELKRSYYKELKGHYFMRINIWHIITSLYNFPSYLPNYNFPS